MWTVESKREKSPCTAIDIGFSSPCPILYVCLIFLGSSSTYLYFESHKIFLFPVLISYMGVCGAKFLQLDPEFVADFAQGELRADMVSGEDFVHPKSNEDANDDTTPLPGNYAVSPHELSLRLHEVIQSQLEERVKELEIALENSQRKVRLLESEDEGNFQKASSFTARGNPLTYEDCDPMSQPLILNLSGEALDAYNEAYEELIKINESEENSPSGIHDGDHKEGSHSPDWNATGVQQCYSDNVTMLEGQSSSIYELNGCGDDESGDCDNEVERQLIRQIVERTKKGYPVFQNAQRILYSMDEDEH